VSRSVSALAFVVAASVLAAPAAGGDGAVNLVAAPRVKRELRAAFLRAHPGFAPRRVRGPLRGSVYYARYRGNHWALATFSLPRVGTTDQPELFRRRLGARWRDLGDTGGSLCEVPRPVVRVWHLLRLRRSC
jgi:hypothetical protein